MSLAIIILSLVFVIGSASMDMCLSVLGRYVNKTRGKDCFIKTPDWRETLLLFFPLKKKS